MGQKINPNSLRLGIIRNWNSCWYSKNDYAGLLRQDYNLRKFLNERLGQAGVSKISVERLAKKVVVTIHTARPGVVIGKKGNGIEKLRADLVKVIGTEVSLNIVEVRKPDVDAKLVAESIAAQIEKRVGFRRAVKRAIQSTLRADIDYGFVTAHTTYGAIGIKVWIYRGEQFNSKPVFLPKRSGERQERE